MPEQPTSTPAAPLTPSSDADSSYGANTNLSPDLQGGPVQDADQQATQDVTERLSGAGKSATEPQ